MTRKSKFESSRSHEEATVESFRKNPEFAGCAKGDGDAADSPSDGQACCVNGRSF